MASNIVKFPVKPKQIISVLEARMPPPEVIEAMGLQPGLMMIGGASPAKQIGSANVRPMLKHAT